MAHKANGGFQSSPGAFILKTAVEPQRHGEHRGEIQEIAAKVVHPDGESHCLGQNSASGFLPGSAGGVAADTPTDPDEHN
jgi:hypothetical protein